MSLRARDRAVDLEELNDTAKAYERDATLVQIVERQIERTPASVAVLSGDVSLTYRELGAQANVLAHRLREAGVGPGSLVGICLERTAAMLVALLATLKAGGAYVPLDPTFPRDRLAFIMADARVALVLSEASVLADLADTLRASNVISIDDEIAARVSEREPVDGALSAGADAYVLYTSGSTGRPKGVPITHRALVNFLTAMADELGLDAAGTLVAVTTLSFDIAGLELWLPLTVGARVAIASREEAIDGERLTALLDRHHATMLQATPATWRLLIASGWRGSAGLTMLCGGEALSPDLARGLLARGGALWNMYGPTETTIWSSIARVWPDEPIGLGRPIANTRFSIVAEDGTPTALGESGELFISGDGVAAGYLHRPELTAARFLPDLQHPGGRTYRTGDLVRLHGDGRLEFLGRIDQQVKVRGFRIELGEIEAALATHPAILQATAKTRTDRTDEVEIVAYCVLRSGMQPTADDVQTHLQRTLPDYMVPAVFAVLEVLPLTPNGKIDRHALPALDANVQQLGRAASAHARNETEAKLVAIFAQVLGIERVGIDDGFFALGGHSLRAARVLASIASAWGVRLTLRAFFENPTVAGLARAIEAETVRESPGAENGLRAPAEVPLTPAQETLWLLDRSVPGGCRAYTLSATAALRGPIDVHALQRALDAMLERHAALRSTVAERDGAAFLIAGPARGVQLAFDDVSDVSNEPDRAGWARLRLRETLDRPFDLTRDVLFRAHLVTLAPDEQLLMVVSHHIVTDGVSFEIILRELGSTYAAESRGENADLPARHVTFADAVARRHARSTEEHVLRLASYWQAHLDGMTDVLALPADYPASDAPDFSGAHVACEFPGALRDRLYALAREHGATLFMVLLAGYATLLYRFCRQDDLVIGVPFAGRDRADFDGIVGYFINTLPLRVGVRAETTFIELLARVRAVCTQAYDHQDIPLERLFSPSSGSGAPFQTLFTFEDAENDLDRFGPLGAALVDIDSGTAKFDLSLDIAERADGLRVLFEYRTARFEQATVEGIAAHFRTLFESIVDHPEAAVGALRILPERDREHLIRTWNATDVAYAREETVVDLFARTLARTPDALAVVFGEAVLTYRELDARASALAIELCRRGSGSGIRVGVCLDRSERLVVALLAIARSGAGYVPLDPALPVARLAFIAADAEVAIVVTERASIATARLVAEEARTGPDGRPAPFIVTVDEERIQNAEEVSCIAVARPEDVAYVLYTSGSTGRPKGVPIVHRALSNLLHSMRGAPGMSEDDVVIAITTLAFDIAGVEMWLPLVVGARIVIAPRPATVDGRQLAAMLDAYAITFMQSTPATWRLLLAGGWRGTPGLRMISCGEALLPELAADLLARGEALWNMYGPTETTVYAALQRVMPGAPIGLGSPMANTQLYVAEPSGEPAPFGVAGELLIGGDGVAAGYLKRPELSAERFISDVFRPRSGMRLYRSGDLARRRRDGRLEYLGRMDDQVKVRGVRIELGEIESVVAAHPAVESAAVVMRPDATGESVIVAYYVARSHEAQRVEGLDAHVRRMLPEVMVPARTIALAELPVTASGKIDRKALPGLAAIDGIHDAYVAPRDEREATIARIMSEILGRSRIGVDDNFFALGGHSLRAMRLLNRLAAAFGAHVPLRAFFERPTVADLARAIAQNDAVPLEAIPRRDESEPTPLSPAQEALWLLDRTTAGGVAYNLPVALRLAGELDVSALQHAVDELVRRHPALRMTFSRVDDETMQCAVRERSVAVERIEILESDPTRRERAALDVACAFAAQKFDLAHDPLLRVLLIRLTPAEHILVLLTHHIVSDGVSLDLLVRDLGTLYADASEEGHVVLAQPTLAFTDVVAWQRARLTPEHMDRLVAYWRRELAAADTALPLPLDRPHMAALDFAGAHLTGSLSLKLLERLQDRARQYDTTLYVVLIACYATLLHRYTGQTDIVVGTPLAARNRTELDGVVGYFVNTVPLRVRFDDDPAFIDVLLRLRETRIAAIEHQDIPFERLAACGGANGPFQTLFTLEDTMHEPRTIGSLEAAFVELETGTAKFDLSLALAERADGLHFSFEYRTAFFDRASIERMASTFHTLLDSVAAAPHQRVGELPLLERADRTRVLEDFNATATAYPRDATIHALFDECAVRTPDAVALELGDARMTYADVQARADGIAAHLRESGVGAGALVGLCAERSFEAIVGLVAILKVGAAYVPLDPAYPAERLAWMIADSGVAVILASRHLIAMVERLLAPAGGATAPRVLGLEDAAFPASEKQHVEACAAVTATAPAYVMYTSGSTGTPKGVVVTHRNVVRLVRDTTYATFERADVLLGFASLSFDASTFEVWGALLNGARIALVPPGTPSLAAIGDVIARRKVTKMWLTAKLFEHVVDAGIASLRGVRHIIAGGEVLSATHVRRALDELPECCISNGYGPTENTTFTACFDVPRGWPPNVALPIGRPISNTRVYVLDACGQPVPIGVYGELYAAGDGVALGYLNRPDLTRERFLADPFARMPDARMYRTGDYARWRPDGTLEFLGRIDGQVKINGYRIEPAEIEAALLRHPGVRAAVVVARTQKTGVTRLVAYCVARLPDELDVERVRVFLAAALPPHLVPSAIVVLEKFPLNLNGKLEREKLPEPSVDMFQTTFLAPRTAAETTLADMWSATLGVARIGVNDNFFSLGGHSLLAMRLVSRIRDTFYVDVPVRVFFEQPTVAQVCDALVARERTVGEVERIAQIVQTVNAMSAADVESASARAPAPEWAP